VCWQLCSRRRFFLRDRPPLRQPIICPDCQSKNINKNGHNRSKQNYICKDCGRQFIKTYSAKGYPESVKQPCLHLYVEGNGFRRIERLTGVCHNTVQRDPPIGCGFPQIGRREMHRKEKREYLYYASLYSLLLMGSVVHLFLPTDLIRGWMKYRGFLDYRAVRDRFFCTSSLRKVLYF
jgi:DNA-directed RNA polymerase subunit RPC12/RpoP